MMKSMAVIAAALISACGSGGGGAASGTGGAAYTIGGSVSGLTGTVVLRNNGNEELSLSANGGFAFATKTADGAAYAVTVKTQPDIQTCTVNNGTGTVSGADVTTIAVLCSTNAYSVGGTVSGLTGTVVLQDNSGDELVLSTDGAFTFATSIADGAGYAVTVKAQPETQTCTVNNGTGTVSGANVTAIAVLCSTNVYSVGGTVSGLTGTLTLRNNGADDLTVTTNGAFTFPTPVVEGAGYVVTLKNWPTAQNCAIVNGTGTISDGPVTNVLAQCADKTWHYPADLADRFDPSAAGVFMQHAAVDRSGNMVVVWIASDGLVWQVYKSEYRNGAWNHPSGPSDNISPDGQVAQFPRVAMDNNGNAVIVWLQSDGSNYRVFKSEYRGGAWTHPASLADGISPAGTDVWEPKVAMDDRGNAVIVWSQSDGDWLQVFKSEYRNGVWTHPIGLNDHISPAGSNAYGYQIAMDQNGNAVVVWYQRDGSSACTEAGTVDAGGIFMLMPVSSPCEQIFKSEYRNGSWTHPADLSDNISPDGKKASSPSVAVSANGDAVIAWTGQDDSADCFSLYEGDGCRQVFKSEYHSGVWTHPAGPSDNISPDGTTADEQETAIDRSGNIVIAWLQYDGAGYNIYRSERRNGAWTHPAGLDSPVSLAGGAGSPQVAMDGNGNALIAWSQDDGTLNCTLTDPFTGAGTPISCSQVYMSEYRNGSWADPADLADNISPDGKSASGPTVGMSDNGNAFILWEQNSELYLGEYR